MPNSRRALIAGCAAGFAFSANYTNHAPMASLLRGEFNFDNAAAGLLTTAIFLTHGIMQIPGGKLADRLGPARVMAVALAWVAIANLSIAFAQAYWQLLFWKAFAGLGTGGCFTAGARYIFAAFEGRALHLAQGFYGASILLGSGFVIFAVPWLQTAFGWRGAFLACAAVAAIIWIAWLIAAPEVPLKAHAAGGLARMLRTPALWLLGLIQMASFGLVIVVGAWIITLLRTAFAMPLKTAGLLGSTVLLLGILSRPLGGVLAHRIPLRSLVCGALLLNAAACAALAWGGSLALTILAITALGIGCGLPYAAVFNRAAALFPGRAGAAMGLVNLVGILMVLAGAPAVGYLADSTGHFRISFIVLGAVAVVAALATTAVPESTTTP